MTDLVIPQTHQAGAVSTIVQTARELDAAYTIAKAIAGTSFVPTHFRGKPDECAVAILYGATVGLDPVTAVQQIFVIGGKPALYARAMVAIVLAQGHEIWTEEETPGRVVVCGRRKGSENVERVEWTTDMAKTAGYTTNKKYQTDSRAMLYARASGDVARRVAPDALMGLTYNVEELELGEIPNTPVETPSERSGVSRLRAALPAKPHTDPEPAAEPAQGNVEPQEPTLDETLTDDVPYTVDGPITEKQRKHLHALVNKLGMDRDTKLAGLSKIAGREITSSNDLTETEAGWAISGLQVKVDQMGAAE